MFHLLIEVILVLLVSAASGAAQTLSAGISGVVRDESAAVLPGVTVEASRVTLVALARASVTLVKTSLSCLA